QVSTRQAWRRRIVYAGKRSGRTILAESTQAHPPGLYRHDGAGPGHDLCDRTLCRGGSGNPSPPVPAQRTDHVHRIARREGRGVEQPRNDDRRVARSNVDRHPGRVLVVRRHVYCASRPKRRILRMAEIRIQSLLGDAEGTCLELLVVHSATLRAHERQTGHDCDGDDSDRYQCSDQREAAAVPRSWVGQAIMIGHLTGLFLKKIAVVMGAASAREAPATVLSLLPFNCSSTPRIVFSAT